MLGLYGMWIPIHNQSDRVAPLITATPTRLRVESIRAVVVGWRHYHHIEDYREVIRSVNQYLMSHLSFVSPL
jgi:hypothetical protein